MKVGEIATPLTKTAKRQQRHGVGEQQRHGGQRDDADGDGELALQRHGEVERADDQADDERAERIDADDEARRARLAELLGDGDRAHLGRGEDRADEDQREGDDLHRPAAGSPSRCAPCATGLTRGSVERCRMKAAEPKREEQRARQHAGLREQRDAEADRQRRAGDIDQLVRRRFEGEGGVELGPVAENLGPARPHHAPVCSASRRRAAPTGTASRPASPDVRRRSAPRRRVPRRSWSGRRRGVWPRRSTSREICGATSALVSA